MEKEIFPEYEPRAAFFNRELRNEDTELLYMEIDEDIVGYVMCSWPSSLFGRITTLAVKEKYRRQGCGEALVKAAIDMGKTRMVQRISADVDASYTAAISLLYNKFGFRADDLVPRSYTLLL